MNQDQMLIKTDRFAFKFLNDLIEGLFVMREINLDFSEAITKLICFYP